MFSIILSLSLALTFISPSISHAAEVNTNDLEEKKLTKFEPTIEPASPEDKNEILEACLKEEMKLEQNNASFNGSVSTYSLPSDFTNLCKIISKKDTDNVTWNTYEQKVLQFLIGGGLGVLNYYTKGTLKTFVVSGAMAVFPSKVPKTQSTYVTIERRECQDSTGINVYLIIKYYKDSKRTQQLHYQYLKA